MKMVLPISYYGMINTKKASTHTKIYQQKNNDKGTFEDWYASKYYSCILHQTIDVQMQSARLDNKYCIYL